MGCYGRVLFIIHDLYQKDNHFPLGPAYLAAILRNLRVKVEIYNQDVYHYSNYQLANYLSKNEFDLICVGFLAARFKETIVDLCRVINKYKGHGWLVLGGHGPSPIPKYMLQTTLADVIIMGEAENTINEVLECKLNKGDLSKIKGIAYQPDNINSRHSPVRNLDSIPFPAWDLFPMKEYSTCLNLYRKNNKDRVLEMLTSRGCANKCNFCYRLEKGIRARSVESSVEEMNILNQRYGITYFLLSDEHFNFSRERIFKFRDELEKQNLNIKFSCSARTDLLDMELGKCLKDCGCQFLNFGIESMDQEVLSLMNKHSRVEDNIRAMEICNILNLGIGLNFIFGNKGDSEESLRRDVDTIKKYNTYDQMRTIRPVTPYPGSDLYYEAINRELLTGPRDFFKKFKNSDLLTINFTKIPSTKFYKLLFNANRELILDYFHHTGRNIREGHRLIRNFYDLYFKGDVTFRGARHYE